MKFFVDTAEIDQIKELNDLGMVDGVTTNPSLIKKSGRDIIEVTKELSFQVEGGGSMLCSSKYSRACVMDHAI